MSARKTFQIRIDEETKAMLDNKRGKLSYNQYLKSVSGDAITLARYRAVVSLLLAVDHEKWRWDTALRDLVRELEL